MFTYRFALMLKFYSDILTYCGWSNGWSISTFWYINSGIVFKKENIMYARLDKDVGLDNVYTTIVEPGGKWCTICKEEGWEAEGQCYCEQCKNILCSICQTHHRRLLKHHSVLEIQKLDVTKWITGDNLDDWCYKCDEHVTERLTLFCKRHGSLCCKGCYSSKHR